MTPTQVEALTDDEVRDEAVRAFDAALAARRRRTAAVIAAATARLEVEDAENAENDAQAEMLYWEGVIYDRGLTLRKAD